MNMSSKSMRWARAAAVAVMAAAAGPAAQAAEADPRGARIVECMNPVALKSRPCPDSFTFTREAQFPVETAWNQGDTAELQRLFDRWCTGKDRMPDGRWYLSWFTGTFQDRLEVWGDWERVQGIVTRWRAASPDSEAARLSEAMFWRAYGWHARGQGVARGVAPEGWALFRERLGKARALLEDVDATCPATASTRLWVATDLGAPDAELRPLFNAAVARFPEYQNLYTAMSRHHEPRWGGSAAAFDAFAREAARTTARFEGLGLYARLYWTVDHEYGQPFTNEPGSRPDWLTLRQGFEDLLAHYPNSQSIRVQFMSVACRSNDSALYRRLRTELAAYAANEMDTALPLEVCDVRHHWQPQR